MRQLGRIFQVHCHVNKVSDNLNPTPFIQTFTKMCVCTRVCVYMCSCVYRNVSEESYQLYTGYLFVVILDGGISKVCSQYTLVLFGVFTMNMYSCIS